MKIGLITDCTKLPLEQAIVKAAQLGVNGVQIYATTGVFSPDMTPDERKRYKKLIENNGLVVSALCGDMGGTHFEKEENNALKVEKTKRIVDLAEYFDTNVVTTHIGSIPDDVNCKKYSVMLKAIAEAGRYAYARGITLAIETGPEKADTLKGFIERTDGGVGVNLDPANFTMCTLEDAVKAVPLLKDYIVHTHAKDGRRVDMAMDFRDIYRGFSEGGELGERAAKAYEELPLGQGDVDWDNYLQALKDIGYDGFLTIEREAGPHPFDDIKNAISFLKDKLSQLK